MREVVTLQLGHLSNYTATHFWNTQVNIPTVPLDSIAHTPAPQSESTDPATGVLLHLLGARYITY